LAAVAGGAGLGWRRPILGGRVDRLDEPVTLRIFPDGTSYGVGPSGTHHDRFRAWKQDLPDT
jgi:hypothetical protein